jgi:YaaC-like protein
MARVAFARVGTRVSIKGRPLSFSYWPMFRTSRRYGLQAHLYATSPWALIRSGIIDKCPAVGKPEALACLAQSEFFFNAGVASSEWAAKPLLLYYSFMNLAKAFILTRSLRADMDQAHHGVSERLRGGKQELLDAYLEVFPSPGLRGTNLFADFWQAVTGAAPTTHLQLDLPFLLPQVVAGHRLWCEAADAAERFVSIEDIHIMQDAAAKQLWLVLHIHASTLSVHDISQLQLLGGAKLQGLFRPIDAIPDKVSGETMLRFEQTTPITYFHRPSDSIPALVASIRNYLWAAATTVRPFREYYLYAAPSAERSQVVPQLISIYAITFYMGSIARYRPQHFDAILSSPFGGQLQEFLSSQPHQFVYLLASDFVKRDITRPSLV